ncbi:MAG: nickel-dependent lactate racemase [Pyrinomonadaceae bacterium]
MIPLSIPFGTDALQFDFPHEQLISFESNSTDEPLSDLEIGNALSNPIGTPAFDDLFQPGETVMLVVPDATRRSGAAQIVNLLLRRLIAIGVAPYDIEVMFANGIHRKTTQAEKESILSKFVADRVRCFDHDAGDLLGLVRVGRTSGGIDVEINRRAVETDHRILIGSVGFHYFAGFGGGRKLLCPGLAGKATIRNTHALAFDRENCVRAKGVGAGLLDGNPVHEAFVEAAGFVPPTFLVNTITRADGEITTMVCGDLKTSHTKICEEYLQSHSVKFEEKRRLVFVGAGGNPYDLNLVQAHKALEASTPLVEKDGRIVLFAECRDGFGGRDFEKALSLGDPDLVARNLKERYSVGGQTAWSLLSIATKFDVTLVTTNREIFGNLPRIKTKTPNAWAEDIRKIDEPAYFVPSGQSSKFARAEFQVPKVESTLKSRIRK